MSSLRPLQWLGLGVLIAYALWLLLFFGRVRPWLMAAVGRRLNLKVREELGGDAAGQYEAVGRNASMSSQLLVWVADLVLLLFGTVGVAALVFVPTFLLAESGALLSYEAELTGRQVTFELPATVTMRASQGTATLTLAVRNDGREPEAQCQLGVADYQARNGYLAGSSAFFALEPGTLRNVELPLRATRPPPGEHEFRVKLECGLERRQVRRATLRVAR